MATPKKCSPVLRICSSIAELHAIGIKKPPRKEVARIADYPGHKSVDFENAVGMALGAGFIECPANGHTLRLSLAGRHCVPKVKPPRNNAEMLLRLHLLLRKKKAPEISFRILEILSDGNVHTLRSIAAAFDGRSNYHTTREFKAAITAINGLKILDKPVKGLDGSIILRDVALPSGRTGRRQRVFVSPATSSDEDHQPASNAVVVPERKPQADSSTSSTAERLQPAERKKQKNQDAQAPQIVTPR